MARRRWRFVLAVFPTDFSCSRVRARQVPLRKRVIHVTCVIDPFTRWMLYASAAHCIVAPIENVVSMKIIGNDDGVCAERDVVSNMMQWSRPVRLDSSIERFFHVVVPARARSRFLPDVRYLFLKNIMTTVII